MWFLLFVFFCFFALVMFVLVLLHSLHFAVDILIFPFFILILHPCSCPFSSFLNHLLSCVYLKLLADCPPCPLSN